MTREWPTVDGEGAAHTIATRCLGLSVYRAAGRIDCSANGESARYDRVSVVGTVDTRYPAVLTTKAQPVTLFGQDSRLPASELEYLTRQSGEPYASFPAAIIVRNMGERIMFHLEPVQHDGTRWVTFSDEAGARMAGGNLASTTDSRLREILSGFLHRLWCAPFQTALSIHDRV